MCYVGEQKYSQLSPLQQLLQSPLNTQLQFSLHDNTQTAEISGGRIPAAVVTFKTVQIDSEINSPFVQSVLLVTSSEKRTERGTDRCRDEVRHFIYTILNTYLHTIDILNCEIPNQATHLPHT
jgi:hypothetical protein